MKTFIPQIWAEAVHRKLIESLDTGIVVALAVRYEREKHLQRLKKRKTLACRRRRTSIKRERRALWDANTKAGER